MWSLSTVPVMVPLATISCAFCQSVHAQQIDVFIYHAAGIDDRS